MSFNSPCPEPRYGRTSCSCKSCFTYCCPFLRSQLLCVGLTCGVAPDMGFTFLSLVSPPNISSQRWVLVPIQAQRGEPCPRMANWRSWPGEQSKEEMQSCLFLLLFQQCELNSRSTPFHPSPCWGDFWGFGFLIQTGNFNMTTQRGSTWNYRPL